MVSNLAKRKRNTEGMTLVETVVALVIFGTVVGSFLPIFGVYKAATIQNDTRLGAVAVSQQVMDELRRNDPSTLPLTGVKEEYPSGVSTAALTYKGKTYKAKITYCDPSSDCSATTRRIKVETYLVGGISTSDPIFQLETVYTKLAQ